MLKYIFKVTKKYLKTLSCITDLMLASRDRQLPFSRWVQTHKTEAKIISFYVMISFPHPSQSSPFLPHKKVAAMRSDKKVSFSSYTLTLLCFCSNILCTLALFTSFWSFYVLETVMFLICKATILPLSELMSQIKKSTWNNCLI